MEEERRYTLAEAKEELGRRECLRFGHDYRISEDDERRPRTLSCERCGLRWAVGERVA